METGNKLVGQVLLSVVDRGQSAFLVGANIRHGADASFRLQEGLGQSDRVRLTGGNGNSKFSSWIRSGLKSDVVISVPHVGTFSLAGCSPTHYKGPRLGGNKGGDIALEELVLSAEFIELHK